MVFYQPDISPESLGQDTDRVDPTFMRELLLRRGRLEDLIRELELHQSTVKKYGIGVAVEEMQRLVSFKPVGKSTFRISYVGDSPEEARDVTAWLADQLVEEELDRRRKQALDSKVFLDKELERVTKDLAVLEKELGDFIARHPRFATTNNDAARENRQTPAAAPSPRRPTGRRPRPPTPAPPAAPKTPPPPDPKLVAERDAAIQELTRASRALAELQSQYTDAHPDVAPAKARVAAAEQKVEAATQAIQASTADDLYAIAAVNCVVCWLWSCRRWPGEGWMRRHWTVSRRNLRAGRLHTLVTAAFSHEDIYHLFHSKDSNCLPPRAV